MYLKVTTISLILSCMGLMTGAMPERFISVDDPVKKVSIYPNPVTSGDVFIKTDAKVKKIEILSIVGDIVFTHVSEPSEDLEINVEELKSGIYLIRLSFSDNTMNIQKFWVK